MSIYIQDSVVGSFKYSANINASLIIANTIEYGIRLTQIAASNNFNVEFKVDNLETLRGVVQKYVLSKRVLLEGDTSWSAWESILEKTVNVNVGSIYKEDNFQVISSSSFIIQPDRYQFKIEFYDLVGQIGALDDVANLSIVLQSVEPAPDTFEISVVNELKAGNILSIPVLGSEVNLPILEATETMIRVSTLPLDMSQPITVPPDVETLLHNYSGATLNTDATIMLSNNKYVAWFTPTYVVVLDNIYAATTVKYGSDSAPEVATPTYNLTSHSLTTNSFYVRVHFPIALKLSGGGGSYVDEGDPIIFKNILGEDKTVTWGYYRQNLDSSYFYIKVYYFIPNNAIDPDAPVDAYPTSISTLGKWYYKEQFKLSDLMKSPLPAEEATPNSDGTYIVQPVDVPLKHMPSGGKVFYVWVGFGYEFPNAVKAMPTIAQIETKKVWL